MLQLTISFAHIHCALQVRWALAIKSAISNKGTSGRVQEKESTEVNWERFDVTFETKAPLLLNVKGVANRNDLQQVTNHWIVVTGFAKSKAGNSGPAETSGKIKQMDIVGGYWFMCCMFAAFSTPLIEFPLLLRLNPAASFLLCHYRVCVDSFACLCLLRTQWAATAWT
jgi:hypothetical protein